METITYELPMPPAELSPNSRLHPMSRHRVRKQYIGDCLMELAHQAGGAYRLPRWARARLSLGFVFTTERRRDADNLTARAKATIDAVVLAGIVPDDSTEHIEIGAVTCRVEKRPHGVVRVRLDRLA